MKEERKSEVSSTKKLVRKSEQESGKKDMRKEGVKKCRKITKK